MNMTTDQNHLNAEPATIEALKPIVLKVLKWPIVDAALTENTNLYEMGLESMNVVELLTDIETAFGIVFDIEDLSAEIFSTFGSLAAFVEAKRHER